MAFLFIKKYPIFYLHVTSKNPGPALNVSLHHTLREGNQCTDFFVKLGTSTDADFLTYASPPKGVCNLLKNDATKTFFFVNYLSF
jgi:hypothetical protein